MISRITTGIVALSLVTVALPRATNGFVADAQLRAPGHHRDEALIGSSSFFHRILAIPKQVYDRISVDVAYTNVWQEFYTFPERRPRTFNLIVATLKTWMADIVVQFGEQFKKPQPAIDWKRSGAFALFGFFYEGLTAWFLYVTIFSGACPNAIRFANRPWAEKLTDHAGQFDLLKQVFADNFIVEIILYFPIFYIIKEMVRTEGSASNRCVNAVKNGLSSYARNFKEDNLASMAVWIPGDFFIFSVPMFMRLPLGHALSFMWTMVLSRMRGEDSQEKKL